MHAGLLKETMKAIVHKMMAVFPNVKFNKLTRM